MKLKSIYSLARNASYDDEGKAKYKRAALKFLRELAEYLNLEKGSFSIHFNAGGCAVAGDPILHHDKFYLNLSPGCMGRGYWRTCKGQKDYTGGMNRDASPSYSLESFASEIEKVCGFAK